MQVTVRNYIDDAPVAGAVVVVDGGTPVTTDGSGIASCSAGATVKVYANQMYQSMDDPHFIGVFTDSADDREIWIDASNGMPPPPGGMNP